MLSINRVAEYRKIEKKNNIISSDGDVSWSPLHDARILYAHGVHLSPASYQVLFLVHIELMMSRSKIVEKQTIFFFNLLHDRELVHIYV